MKQETQDVQAVVPHPIPHGSAMSNVLVTAILKEAGKHLVEGFPAHLVARSGARQQEWGLRGLGGWNLVLPWYWNRLGRV